VLGHHCVVDVAPPEDAAVDLRVQGLHPAIHHLGKAGVVAHLGDGDAVFLQQSGGTAGGEDLHACLRQALGEFHHAGLVGDTDECSGDLAHDSDSWEKTGKERVQLRS